jgi:hypothetical protein
LGRHVGDKSIHGWAARCGADARRGRLGAGLITPVMPTRAPKAASPMAVALPIPPVPPVTRADFPAMRGTSAMVRFLGSSKGVPKMEQQYRVRRTVSGDQRAVPPGGAGHRMSTPASSHARWHRNQRRAMSPASAGKSRRGYGFGEQGASGPVLRSAVRPASGTICFVIERVHPDTLICRARHEVDRAYRSGGAGAGTVRSGA